jgi:hypothetical protein
MSAGGWVATQRGFKESFGPQVPYLLSASPYFWKTRKLISYFKICAVLGE